MNFALRFHVNREGMSYWIHGRDVPGYNRNFWAAYSRASVTNNSVGRTRALHNILLLPRHALRKARGGANRLKTQLFKILRLLEDGELSPDLFNIDEPADIYSAVFTDPDDPDKQRVRRCVELVRNGYASKAVKTLLSTGLVEPTQERIDQLRALFPPPSKPIPPVPHDLSGVAPIAVAPKQLKDIVVKQCRTTTSPAISGWTGELIAELVVDDTCFQGIVALTSDILCGRLSEAARVLLLSCTLYAGGKPDGGVRPLAPGEAFIKVAELYPARQSGEQKSISSQHAQS